MQNSLKIVLRCIPSEIVLESLLMLSVQNEVVEFVVFQQLG